MKILVLFALTVCLCSCGPDKSAEIQRQQAEIERLQQVAAQKDEELKQQEKALAAKALQEKEEKDALYLKEIQAKAAAARSKELAEQQAKELADKQAKELEVKQAAVTAEKQKKEFIDNSVVCPFCRGTQIVRLKKSSPCEKCGSTGLIETTSSHGTKSSSSKNNSKVLCSSCDGAGSSQSATNSACPFCANGRILKADLAKVLRCKKCMGTGEIDAKKLALCATCNGRGEKEGMLKSKDSSYPYYRYRSSSAPTYREMLPCTFCNGSGTISKPCKQACDECTGLGAIRIN